MKGIEINFHFDRSLYRSRDINRVSSFKRCHLLRLSLIKIYKSLSGRLLRYILVKNAAVVQWCQRSPHKPVFPGSNPGGGSCLSQTAGDVSKVFIAMKKHSGSDSTLNSRSILSMFCLSALQLRKNITASALTRKRVVIASKSKHDFKAPSLPSLM